MNKDSHVKEKDALRERLETLRFPRHPQTEHKQTKDRGLETGGEAGWVFQGFFPQLTSLLPLLEVLPF